MKNFKKYSKYIFLFICMFILLENVSAAGFMNDIDKKSVICNGTEIPYGIPYIVHNIVNLIKVGIPIVLIILGMIDFLKAVIASDEKQMKDAQTTFIRRLIASVIIFFVFVIVQFVFSLVDDDGVLGCVNCIINKECGPVEMYGDSSGNNGNNNDTDTDNSCELYKQSGSICGWDTKQECIGSCKETTDVYKCELGTSTCAMGSGTLSTIYTAKRCEKAGCEKYKNGEPAQNNNNNNKDNNNGKDCGCELYKQSGSVCGWTTEQKCISSCKKTTDIYKCEYGTGSTCAAGSGKMSTIYTGKRCEMAGCEKYKTCNN